MNQRLEFYRQLQQISDTVAPIQEEASDEVSERMLIGTKKNHSDAPR